MNKLLYLIRIIMLAATMVLLPAANAQQDTPPDTGSRVIVQSIHVSVTGSWESECLLPGDKEGYAYNEYGQSLIACKGMTVTYTARLSDGHSATDWSWTVTGAVTYNNLNDGSVIVNWGDGDNGQLMIEATADNGENILETVEVLLIEKPVAQVITTPSYEIVGDEMYITACNGETIYFNNITSTESSDIAGYFWEGGELPASSHDYTIVADERYSKVVHVVYNNCGCSDTLIFYIKVLHDEPLELDCYGTVCEGTFATYTALNANCDSYDWYIEGGRIQDGDGTPTVIVEWGTPPEGYGILGLDGTSCEGLCQGIQSKRIPIMVDGVHITGQTTACVGEGILYKVPLYGSTDYEWSITPDDRTLLDWYIINGANEITVFFHQEGVYQITVAYQGDILDCGEFHSDTITVTVKPKLSIVGGSRVCVGNPCDIHSDPLEPSTLWTVRRANNDEILHSNEGEALDYIFTEAGKYVVTAEADGYCHPATLLLTVKPSPDPPSLDGLSGPSEACPNTSVLLTGTPTDPTYSLVWRPECSDASPQQVSGSEVTIRYRDTVCNIHVYQYDRMLGCLSADYAVFPIEQFKLDSVRIPGNLTVCPGDILDWTNSVPYQEDVIYEWQLQENRQNLASLQGDIFSNSATLYINELDNTHSATFFVDLFRTYCDGIIDTTRINITVTDTLVGAVSIDPISSVCQGEQVTLNGHGCDFNDYIWTFDSRNLYGTSLQVLADEPGHHIVTLTCNPYDNCSNTAYLTTVTAEFEVFATPPALALVSSGGRIHVVPELDETEYLFTWAHTTTHSQSVPMDPTVSHYTCTVTRIDEPHCSKTLEADTAESCEPLTVVCLERDYCAETATFSVSNPPDGYHQTKWTVIGNEYGDMTDMQHIGDEITISMNKLGHYMVIAHIEGEPCYTGYILYEVDFVPNFSVEKQCTEVTIVNNSRYLYEDKNVVISYNGQSVSFPVSQHEYLLGTLDDGNYQFSLSEYDGRTHSCDISSLTVVNSGGATLHIVTENTENPNNVCDNTAIKLTVSSESAIDLNNILWGFGDGSHFTTTTNSVYHTFAGNGDYPVIVTMTDANGCISYGTIMLYSFPNELKNPSIRIITLDGEEVLVCSGSEKKIKYQINDFNPSDNLDPVPYYFWCEEETATTDYTYTTYHTGDYYVTAFNSNFCKAKTMRNVPFKNKPTAMIVAESNAYCVGEPIRLYGSPDPDIENYTFNWTVYRDGSLFLLGNNANLVFTPAYAGHYEVSLTVTNTDGCTSQAYESLVVNQTPRAPSIDFAGNQCVHTPPVILRAETETGNEIHWSNGNRGERAEYYTPGVATAWYYDANTGCRSNDSPKAIAYPPDFDALLTGCYNRCKDFFEEHRNLNVWGLIHDHRSVSWDWRFNGERIASGEYGNCGMPLDLPLADFGDYRLVVTYGNGCLDSSLFLSFRESCPCDLAIKTELKLSDKGKCQPEYIVTIHVDNPTENIVCFDNIQLENVESDGVRISQQNIVGRQIGPNEHGIYEVRLGVDYLIQSTVQFVLHDSCNNCTQYFTVDLTEARVDCNNRIERLTVQYRYNLSTQDAIYFDFNTTINSPFSSVFACWSEPQMVLDYSRYGNHSIRGLAMIDRQELARMARNRETICFYAIVCNHGRICKLSYCIRADRLQHDLIDPFPPFPPIPPFPPRPHFPFFSTGAGNSYGGEGFENLEIRNSKFEISISPNPTSGKVRVMGYSGDVVAIEVLDMHGRKLIAIEGTDSFDVSSLPAGQYIVRVSTTSSQSDDSTLTQSSSQSFSQSEDTHYLKLIKK